MDKVGVDVKRRYFDLCFFLLNEPFYWDENMISDANRAEDGKSLRHLYLRERGEVSGMTDEPCSVLEMLVAFALRIELDIMGEPGADNPGRWFHLMLENLGISSCSNGNMNKRLVTYHIDTWMWREFTPRGHGSLFPLREYPGDQRELPIWDQMNFYLNENY